MYCVSLHGFKMQCGLELTNIKLQALQDKAEVLLLENIFRSGISNVMGDRFVKFDENK